MKPKGVLITTMLLLTLGLPVMAQATTEVLPSSIQLIGDAKELAFTETGEPGFLYTDKFLPGETLERTLTIRNEKNVPFRLSFAVERTSEIVPEIDLFNQLDITIYDPDTKETLCTGAIENCDDRQLYAILQPGDVRNLKMIVTFNKEAGNEYKNKAAQYEWIFDAVVEPTTTPREPEPTVPEKVTRPIFTTGNPLVNTGLFALEITAFGAVLFAGGRYLIKRKK